MLHGVVSLFSSAFVMLSWTVPKMLTATITLAGQNVIAMWEGWRGFKHMASNDQQEVTQASSFIFELSSWFSGLFMVSLFEVIFVL